MEKKLYSIPFLVRCVWMGTMFVKQLNVEGKKGQRNSNNYDLVLEGPEINDTPLCNSRSGHKVFYLSETY